MDAFNSKDFYGHSLSEDPKLRTTARNYEFKYNSSDHLERIINRVRMDRETKKQGGTFQGRTKHRGPCFKTESSQLLTPPIVHTQVGRLNSRETIVKIMSDEDIEALVSQALNSDTNLDPVMVKQNSEYDLSSGHVQQINHEEPEEIRKEVKSSKFALELLPTLQPKWVEIKPIQKAFSRTLDVPAATSEDVLSDCENMSGLNLSCDSTNNEVVQSKQTPDREHLVDAFSLNSEMTEDFVIRNQDLSGEEEEPSVGRPFSPEIDLHLNESEHLEMERVFGKALPQISPLDFGKFDCQVESEYSEPEIEKEDRGLQEHAAGLTDEEFYIQPVVHIQHHLSKPSPGRSERSANSSLPRTSESTKKSHRSMNATTFRSSIALETPVEKRLRNQMESLKQEKMRIFSKMTSIQGHIVETLDSLRQSLLRVSLTYDQAEKTSRERNGLEFFVRFSRNYLFPLEKMIEKLQTSPKENYHSALTNEPCVKVCGIYGLLSQALECYQKQLRHFFTDNVPKKLDVLLNMIKDTTTICLEKHIFDKQDTLIQCLLSRCDVFLEFVMEFEENKKSARKEESVWSTHRDQHKLSKTSSKWDLTMNLNKLNMYEPKLVQKKPKKKIEGKIVQPNKLRPTPKPKGVKKQKLTSNDKKDEDDIKLPNEDPIETQVRKDNMIDSVELINAAISEHPDSELANSVIETLQDITKDEVRHIFAPIVSNLGSILKSSGNPQTTVESVLDVLSLQLQRARSKELKIDAAATENSTQNRNTYQKGVTKKGTHSSRYEQQQRKESRQHKLTNKAKKTTSGCSNNVKEGSTEQTERYNSRGGLTDTNTICDKQSLSNDDDVAAVVSENDSVAMKQKTRNGAFVSAAAAKKPTRAPIVDGKATAAAPVPPPSLTVLPVQLDEVIPPPPPPLQLQSNKMTSQPYTASLITVGVPHQTQADTFAPKQRILDEGYGYQTDEFQRTVRDGAANALDGGKQNKIDRRKNLPAAASSSVRNGTAMSMSGQILHFNYQPNALYTFVKHFEGNLTSSDQQMPYLENLQEEETLQSVEAEMSTNISADLNEGTQSSEGVQEQLEEETRNLLDVKALLEERQAFIDRCKKDPLYSNPQFSQPWKVLSKISHSIAKEIVESFENDLSFGEESYVRDFINMEMQT